MPSTLIDRLKAGAERTFPTFLGASDTIATVRARHPEFGDVVEEIRALGTDSFQICGDDYHLEGGMSLQQRTNEFAALLLYLQDRDPKGTYLEIGTASGGTCKLINERVPFPQVLSLDDGQHPRAHLQDGNLAGIENLERYIGDSHAPAARAFIAEHLKGPLDVAFIDGDHSYEGVLADTKLVLEFAHPETLLVYHDTRASHPVMRHWLTAAASGLFRPVAHFVDDRRGALGIAVAQPAQETRPRTALGNLL